MLFLAKSALCIGIVAIAASGLRPSDVAAALGGDARTVADGARRACLASSDCLRLGAEAAVAAAGPAGSRPVRPTVARGRREPAS